MIPETIHGFYTVNPRTCQLRKNRVKPIYKDELTTIYCGDSLEILPRLKQVDLVLTDPPYGINKSWEQKWTDKTSRGNSKFWGEIPEWDIKPISDKFMTIVRKSGKQNIIWGGNYYQLPLCPCWLVWDKIQHFHSADCEFAWTNLSTPPRIFRMSRIDAYKNKAMFPKKHGNEKPVQLFQFCLKLVKECQTMIDPFMGTGNSLVAARLKGIKNIGIDMNEDYCQEAISRVSKGRTRQFKSQKGFHRILT